MTVTALLDILQEMLDAGAIRGDSKVTIAVESVHQTGYEPLAEYVVSAWFGKLACLFCYRPLLLETDPSRMMGYQDFIQKATGERPVYLREPEPSKNEPGEDTDQE